MTLAWTFVMVHIFNYNDLQDRLYQRQQALPDNAIIIPGAGSTSAEYLRLVGGRESWHIITTDVARFDWSPTALHAAITEHLADGKRAFVNMNYEGWGRPGSPPWEWNNLNEVVSKFETRPVDDHFVELLPKQD